MTQLALVIDLNVCVGCHACVTSCKSWNTSGWAGPLPDERPYDEDPSGVFFNRVQTYEVGTYPNTETVHFPKSCLHCADAPCVTVCPTGTLAIESGVAFPSRSSRNRASATSRTRPSSSEKRARSASTPFAVASSLVSAQTRASLAPGGLCAAAECL